MILFAENIYVTVTLLLISSGVTGYLLSLKTLEPEPEAIAETASESSEKPVED